MNLLPRTPRQRGATALALVAASAAALWNRSKAREAERKTPPIGEFVEAGGVRLHYLRKGSGSPIVLLHGNGAMIQDWQISGILDDLASDHEVIAFDRPGFGYSTRPRTTVWTPAVQAKVIVEAMARLGIPRATVVGQSFGALVAAQMALDDPHAVERLVLISGYYYPTPRADAVLFSPAALPLIGDVMRHTISPLIGQAMKPLLYRQLFWPAPVSPEWERAFPSGLSLRPGQLQGFSAEAGLMVPAAAEASSRYAELAMPVTIVTGEGDKFVTPNPQSKRLHQDVPQSELVVVEGAGHMVHHTAPDRVIAAIRG